MEELRIKAYGTQGKAFFFHKILIYMYCLDKEFANNVQSVFIPVHSKHEKLEFLKIDMYTFHLYFLGF